MRARVRGIYATALTGHLLDAGHEVVQASGPIERRFETTFDDGDHDVAVETTDDRQGVSVTGVPGAVETASESIGTVGRDAFVWPAPAPLNAVFDGRVTDTLGRGAVVDLGDAEGFLPYDAASDHVEAGDVYRVQVRTTSPPWVDRRPVLGTDLRVSGGLATLERGGEGVTVATRDDAAGRELAGMTQLLDVTAPDGWGVRWEAAATDADMDALATALETTTERARELESALESKLDAPRRVSAPAATTWIWFGRESRFALDERRRETTATMPGHHRIKAATGSASAAVDFVEALCDPAGEFPFDVVARQFGPTEGDRVRIGHGKPDGRLVVLGEGEVTERGTDGTVEVRREMSPGGEYDALGTPRSAGDVAVTKFREGRWWYPTVYRSADGERKGTYVNVCTPVECFPDVIRYVDLHVDVVKSPDGTVERVDDDELDQAVAAGQVTTELAERARSVARSLQNAL